MSCGALGCTRCGSGAGEGAERASGEEVALVGAGVDLAATRCLGTSVVVGLVGRLRDLTVEPGAAGATAAGVEDAAGLSLIHI